MLDLVYFLPDDIKSKILIQYLSYGTPSAKIIRSEIKSKCRNNTISLWFANVDYYTLSNKKYLLNKCIGYSPFKVICELRLAIIDNNILNDTVDNNLRTSYINIVNNINTITKNDLLRIIDEEKLPFI